MRINAVRHAGWCVGRAPSARAGMAMTVEDANANAVQPGNGRLA